MRVPVSGSAWWRVTRRPEIRVAEMAHAAGLSVIPPRATSTERRPRRRSYVALWLEPSPFGSLRSDLALADCVGQRRRPRRQRLSTFGSSVVRREVPWAASRGQRVEGPSEPPGERSRGVRVRWALPVRCGHESRPGLAARAVQPSGRNTDNRAKVLLWVQSSRSAASAWRRRSTASCSRRPASSVATRSSGTVGAGAPRHRSLGSRRGVRSKGLGVPPWRAW
jgi:hypothetical protein